MRRILLDEGFPDPPGFDPADVQGFDTLVTRDWRQSEQPEEMWILTQTELSVVTWRRPTEDPIVEWAQFLAYIPQLRRLRGEVGPAVFFIPSTQLNARQHVARASKALHDLAEKEGRSRREVVDGARSSIADWLRAHGQLLRHAQQLGL